MIEPEELRHLNSGLRSGEVPGGIGLVELAVTASDPDEVVSRAKEALRAVLCMTPAEMDSEEVWSARLPTWFIQRCAPQQTPAETAAWLSWWRSLDADARAEAARQRPWSVADWIHWLQPDERQWFWWDAVVDGERSARISVEVPGWPVPLGALEWLLSVAGAESAAGQILFKHFAR
ncbi:MAG: hypothetical protein ACRDPW_01480 [Mycobacteriales bacterium]